MVADGTLDLGITNPARSYARHLAIQYTDLIMVGYLKFVCFPPLPLPPYRNVIIPFTLNVWIGVALSLIAITIAMIVIHHINFYIPAPPAAESTKHQGLNKRRKPASLLYYWLLMFAALTGESIIHWTDKWRSSSSSRILTLIWFLACLLLVQSYSCNLRAILIKIEYEKPLDTFQQLADRVIIP